MSFEKLESPKSEQPLMALLLDHGRVLSLLAGSTEIGGFLKRTVEMVAERLSAGVCSIYLYEESAQELVLRATFGLNQSAVNTLRLKRGQGLVGAAFENRQILNTRNASNDPRFRPVPSINEEAFENFLAIPIHRGAESIGVLVTQRKALLPFTADEVVVLQVLTSQLVGAIEGARVLLEVRHLGDGPARKHSSKSVFSGGQTVFPGIAYGPVRVVGQESASQAIRSIAEETGIGDAAALQVAMDLTREQLSTIQRRLEDRLPEAVSLVVDAQLMMLADEALLRRIRDSMQEGHSATRAFAMAVLHYMDLFERSSHDYMKEKAQDVADFGIRVLRNLQDKGHIGGADLSSEIIVAGDLLPSDVLMVAAENVSGLVLVSGGITAHVSLLVRSLRIPMIFSGDRELLLLRDGQRVLLDADDKCLLVEPDEAVRAPYQDRLRSRQIPLHERTPAKVETYTRDGHRIKLLANINLLSDVELALAANAEGVGLYRTEVPFLLSAMVPTQEEQVAIYRSLFGKLVGKEIVVRTLDVGGDKMLRQYDDAGESNPALGLRSTRFTLHHPEIFDDQLSAMMRAAHGVSPVKIMFPMISSVDEFLRARAQLYACHARLSKILSGDVAMPEIGVMLEVPSAVEMIDSFLPHADFFSIGTNDLVQYLLAVDRSNAKVASYYCEHHPAVIRALARLCRTLRDAGAEFSVCGEMAHNARFIPFFVGVGVTRLSLDASFVAEVQHVVEGFDVASAEAYAQALLECRSICETEAVIAQYASLYSPA
ncbi:MAG: phosphoenolpyruvate--protein phosphotransferase [Verrucomicrobia bacterium]|nr:phosphoenolpyruvate--protein phosphotransferase [Verrucomicrobiota bacterium]